MVISKAELKASLAPAFAKRDFKLERLNGQVAKPMAEALQLGKLFAKKRLSQFQEMLLDEPEISPRLYNSIASCIRKKNLRQEELFTRIENAFLRNRIYVDNTHGEFGIVLDSFDVDRFSTYVILSDSQEKWQNGGRTFFNNGKTHSIVNATSAAAHATSAIEEWFAVYETSETRKIETAKETCFDILHHDPRQIIAVNAWSSILGRVNLLSWNASDETGFAMDIANLFAASCAVHEMAHILDVLARGKQDIQLKKIELERTAYAMQALYSHTGVALNSMEERGIVQKIFPDLIDWVKGLGIEAFELGDKRIREFILESIDRHFIRLFGVRHDEIIDTSLLKEMHRERVIRDEHSQFIMAALHLPKDE